MPWIVVGLASVLALFVLLVSVSEPDTAEQDVERFINEHGFIEGVSGGLDRQLSHTSRDSYYYSLINPTTEEEEAAFDSLTVLADGWRVENEDEFGRVYVNGRKGNLVYSVEIRREFVLETGLDGTVTKKPGSELMLAVEHNESGATTLWRKIMIRLGL